jgi:hypothetical protein
MNYILFPILHGVEVRPVKSDYAGPLIEGVCKYLTEEERGYFIPLPYNYSVKTDPRQLQMFNAVEEGLGNRELRRLKNVVGSDVTWSFILAKNGGSCFYTQVVEDLKNILTEAINKYPLSKIVCCGHSQGTQLLYSFFFDASINIEGFISMGSPISMNSGAYPDWGKKPPLNWWMNFYNDMDFISSKMERVHPSKAIADLVKDFKVPLGWNPLYHLPQSIFKIQAVAGLLAHIMYWESDFVHQKIAGKISSLISQPQLQG